MTMSAGAEPGLKMRAPRKSATAYRTISEVSEELAVPQHVLRFWETKFSQVRPLKRGGGRRYYRPEDVALLRRIQKLLYEDGFTIKGVQKLLREGRGSEAAAEPQPVDDGLFAAVEAQPAPDAEPAQGGLSPELRDELADLLGELRVLRAALKGFGA